MSLPWRADRPKRVFISGGSSGIGQEFARRLAQEGADVAIFSRKLAPQVIAALRKVAISKKQCFKSYSADVADEAAIRTAIEKAIAEMGPPDLVINSAGIQLAAPFESATSDDFNRVIQVNLGGSRNFAAAVMPHLAKGSHLVLVASLAGLTGNFAYAAYCASKHGVMGLAAVLRVEMKLKGIDVSVCCPGEVETPMIANEQTTIHPVTEALRAFAGSLRLEPACDEMLRGIARRQYEIIPGFKPRLTAFLVRHVPTLMHRIVDDLAAKTARSL
jgi:NAD(P)-dependent dehydrogenase (short-subunit alcohol dehydrogenase family)